ncbi:MAG: hypothetical protein WCG55_01430 [bacterium]
MMSLYFTAWLASIMSGAEAILGKITSRHSVRNPWLFNFFWSLFILVGIIIAAIYSHAGIPSSWSYIVSASIAYALTGTTYAFSVYTLDASVVAPLYSMRTIMAVAVGSLFFGETLSSHQYILIGIIFVFGILVSMDEKFSLRSFFNWKITRALFGMACLLALSLLTKKAIAVAGFWNSTLWIALLGQVWLLATIPLFKKEWQSTSKKQLGAIALVSAAGVVGTISAMAAYSKNVSIATAIISLPLSMIAAIGLSFIAPDLLEKHTAKVYAVRIISATIMIIAALKL